VSVGAVIDLVSFVERFNAFADEDEQRFLFILNVFMSNKRIVFACAARAAFGLCRACEGDVR
jgi:hypothetical protein